MHLGPKMKTKLRTFIYLNKCFLNKKLLKSLKLYYLVLDAKKVYRHKKNLDKTFHIGWCSILIVISKKIMLVVNLDEN